MIKRVTTVTGTNAIAFDEFHPFFWVKNIGSTTVYASEYCEIKEENLARIEPNEAVRINNGDDCCLYIVGEGEVEIHAEDFVENPFKLAATGGGASGGEYTIDTELSTTSENPVQNKAIAAAITNPNLLINPDFTINQRGQTEYTGDDIHCADRWIIQAPNGETIVTMLQCGVHIENTGINTGVKQHIEANQLKEGATYTISIEINGVRYSTQLIASKSDDVKRYGDTPYHAAITFSEEYNIWVVYPYVVYVENCSVDLRDAKLEPGSVATQFIPPDSATELVKCQRYFEPMVIVGNPYGALPDSIITQGFFKVTKRIVPTLTITSLNGIDMDAMGTVGNTAPKIPIKAYVDGSRFHLDYAGLSESDTTPCDHNGNVGCTIYANAEI